MKSSHPTTAGRRTALPVMRTQGAIVRQIDRKCRRLGAYIRVWWRSVEDVFFLNNYLCCLADRYRVPLSCFNVRKIGAETLDRCPNCADVKDDVDVDTSRAFLEYDVIYDVSWYCDVIEQSARWLSAHQTNMCRFRLYPLMIVNYNYTLFDHSICRLI